MQLLKHEASLYFKIKGGDAKRKMILSRTYKFDSKTVFTENIKEGVLRDFRSYMSEMIILYERKYECILEGINMHSEYDISTQIESEVSYDFEETVLRFGG